MPKQTTHAEVSSIANALAAARGHGIHIDEADVRIYLSTPVSIRRMVMSPLRADYIEQALDFLLSEYAPKA